MPSPNPPAPQGAQVVEDWLEANDLERPLGIVGARAMGDLKRRIDAALRAAHERAEPRADDDGHCTRCGCIWWEEGITDPHECPPGFWTAMERRAHERAENLKHIHGVATAHQEAAEQEQVALLARVEAAERERFERGTFVIHFDKRTVHRIDEPCPSGVCP